MICICNDHHDTRIETRWHRAYCRWYDNDRAGHWLRATAWGWWADRLARRVRSRPGDRT